MAIRLIGEASLETVRIREAIADNYLAQGRKEEAKRLYLQLELELEKSFGADSAVVKHIREKGNAI